MFINMRLSLKSQKIRDLAYRGTVMHDAFVVVRCSECVVFHARIGDLLEVSSGLGIDVFLQHREVVIPVCAFHFVDQAEAMT